MTDQDLKKIGELINSKLESVNNKLDQHTAALMSIESKLDGYGDMYKFNQDHIQRLDKRVGTLEDKAGVTPPEELTIPNFK